MKIIFSGDMSFNYFDGFPGSEKVQNAMCEVADEFKKADFGVVNLENIFGEKSLFTPIVKSGPNLISDERFMEYIDAISPSVVNLANNHSKDFGEDALFFTMELVRKKGYQIIGAGKNIEEAYRPAILEKGGIKCAIIGVCENEFGIADTEASGTAGYKLGMVTKAIMEAKAIDAMPIIYFHGGNEYNPFPSPGKVELYRHFINLGAKAVIAMHTHCPQGYEIYNECPIIYSMGNFFFPAAGNHTKSWFYGYITVLDITASEIETSIIPYTFDFDGIKLLRDAELAKFNKYIEFLSKEIKNPEGIKKYFDAWCMESGIGYSYALTFDRENYEDYTSADLAPLKNLLDCEAHTELISNTIKIIFEGRAKSAKNELEKIKKLQNIEL